MKGLMMKEIIMIKKMTFPIIIFLAAGVMSGVGGGNPFFCLVIVVFLSRSEERRVGKECRL